jgi:Helix-turn-helix domain of resolvase
MESAVDEPGPSRRQSVDTLLGEKDRVAGGLGELLDAGSDVDGVTDQGRLAELELELGRERRTASLEAQRARGQSIGRPKALDQSKIALAQRIHASGESASTIASTLGVSRAPVYRVLAVRDASGE